MGRMGEFLTLGNVTAFPDFVACGACTIFSLLVAILLVLESTVFCFSAGF